MKAIVGVDRDGLYRNAIRLFCRFQFPKPQTVLVHAADPALPVPGLPFDVTGTVQEEVTKSVLEAGEALLDEAQDEACALGMCTEVSLQLGTAAAALLHYAKDHASDLIAVTSARKGAFGSLFFGSVSRSLALSAHCPVLVAKGTIHPRGKLIGVFATDHSVFATRSINRFLEMKPKGFEHVIIATAYDVDDESARLLHANLAHHGGMVEEWIEEQMNGLGQPLVERFREAGISAEYRAIQGHPNDVLRRLMEQSGADVLMMGAQGHSFMEHLVIGSISMHQVVAEAYPVLLMRE